MTDNNNGDQKDPEKGKLLVLPPQKRKPMPPDQVVDLTRKQLIDQLKLPENTSLDAVSNYQSAFEFEEREVYLRGHFDSRLKTALASLGFSPETVALAVQTGKKPHEMLNWREISKAFDQLLAELLRRELKLPEGVTLEQVMKHSKATSDVFERVYGSMTAILIFPEGHYETVTDCIDKGIEYDQKRRLIMARKFDQPHELKRHLTQKLNELAPIWNLDESMSWTILYSVISKWVSDQKLKQSGLPAEATQKEVELKLTQKEHQQIENKLTDALEFPRGTFDALMAAVEKGTDLEN